MEDTEEGVLNFDFEGGGLDANPSASSVPMMISTDHHQHQQHNPTVAITEQIPGGGHHNGRRRSFRQTVVCRHWLRSLCMKGDGCGFLHQYDMSRMPVCQFFRLSGECRHQDCVYKHTNNKHLFIKDCNMYKLGFCPNGPDCRYRHAKLPGPPPSIQEVSQKIQQHLTSFNYASSSQVGANTRNQGLAIKQPAYNC